DPVTHQTRTPGLCRGLGVPASGTESACVRPIDLPAAFGSPHAPGSPGGPAALLHRAAPLSACVRPPDLPPSGPLLSPTAPPGCEPGSSPSGPPALPLAHHQAVRLHAQDVGDVAGPVLFDRQVNRLVLVGRIKPPQLRLARLHLHFHPE